MVNRSEIELLSHSVIEKIAAGEVIERPASVMKELVENALDAGANRIDVVVENAGFSLIKIIDNGSGMTSDNLQKSVIRHCTSKIRTADDLFAVSTMGFRGEALASISAVSRFSISTSVDDSGLGSVIESEGGALAKVEPAPHPKGTTVECRDLFYNVPARKKFMKTERAERGAMNRLMEQVVTSFPAIHFTYTAEGKKVFDIPAVSDIKSRIAQVAGVELATNLIECSINKEGLSAQIFVTNPHKARMRPRFKNLYVNLRRVDNDAVTNAVREAFSRFIMSNHKADWFCFLSVDSDKIDVNVHPTKQKIKFDDERALFSTIFHAIHDGLSVELDSAKDLIHSDVKATYSSGSNTSGATFYRDSYNSFTEFAETNTLSLYDNQKSGGNDNRNESVQTALSFISDINSEKSVANSDTSNVQSEQEAWGMISCYQLHKMYIIAPIKSGMIIVDQHAAHERILYEEALRSIEQGKGESQRLLFPITFDMSSDEKELVLSVRSYFETLGFDIQDFGGKTVAVSAIPATGFLEESDVEEAVREMATALLEEKDPEIVAAPEKRFAASYACGSAIKFGKSLKQEEMNSLLNTLFSVGNPNICPHGRPTIIRMSLDELVKRFLR